MLPVRNYTPEDIIRILWFRKWILLAGMIITAVGLLQEKPRPTDAEIVAGMNHNICRCCSYPKIFQAVRRAAGAAGEVKS